MSSPLHNRSEVLGVTTGSVAGEPSKNILKNILHGFSFDNYADMTRGGIAVCLVVYCLMLVLFPIEPVDDLLRHMTSYQYRYDYTLMYPASPGVPTWNMYFVFDVLAGFVHSSLGQYGFVLIQLAATILFASATYWLLRGATSTNLRFVLLMSALALCFNRITLARPSTFESGLFLLALAACGDERVKWWGHALLGAAMSCFYYLFWIYLIPLMFLRRIYALPLIGGLLGWSLYGGKDYFRVLHEILTMKSRRGFAIVEASPILLTLLTVSIILLPAACYWAKDKKRFFATSFFLLSNQSRYLEIIIPSFLSFAKNWNVNLSQSAVVLITVTLISYRSHTGGDDSFRLLKDVVPAKSRVLCLEIGPMFKTLYANKGLQISPCMEPGWDSRELVKSIVDAEKTGEFNPTVLSTYPYDYLIEKNLRKIPAGLELVRISGKYRIWKIPETMKPAMRGRA